MDEKNLFEDSNVIRKKSEEIDKVIDDIHDMRKDSIIRDGEFGIGNLVFKELRRMGYLDNLKKLKDNLVSKELSL